MISTQTKSNHGYKPRQTQKLQVMVQTATRRLHTQKYVGAVEKLKTQN